MNDLIIIREICNNKKFNLYENLSKNSDKHFFINNILNCLRNNIGNVKFAKDFFDYHYTKKAKNKDWKIHELKVNDFLKNKIGQQIKLINQNIIIKNVDYQCKLDKKCDNKIEIIKRNDDGKIVNEIWGIQVKGDNYGFVENWLTIQKLKKKIIEIEGTKQEKDIAIKEVDEIYNKIINGEYNNILKNNLEKYKEFWKKKFHNCNEIHKKLKDKDKNFEKNKKKYVNLLTGKFSIIKFNNRLINNEIMKYNDIKFCKLGLNITTKNKGNQFLIKSKLLKKIFIFGTKKKHQFLYITLPHIYSEIKTSEFKKITNEYYNEIKLYWNLRPIYNTSDSQLNMKSFVNDFKIEDKIYKNINNNVNLNYNDYCNYDKKMDVKELIKYIDKVKIEINQNTEIKKYC